MMAGVPPTKEDREFMINRLIVKAVAITIGSVFLMLTTCTMHMNSYNPDEARAETEIAKAETIKSQQKHTENMERLKVVEKLIKEQKIDPIAARCAVEGWTEKNSDVCLAIVAPAAAEEDKKGLTINVEAGRANANQ